MESAECFKIHKNSAGDRDFGMGVYVAGTGGGTPQKQLTDNHIEATIENYFVPHPTGGLGKSIFPFKYLPNILFLMI